MIPSLNSKIRNARRSGYQQLIKKVICDGSAYPVFSQIPQYFTHLNLIVMMRSTGASRPLVFMRYNDDSGSFYSYQISSSVGATSSSFAASSATSNFIGNTLGNADNAAVLSNFDAKIFLYSSNVFWKNCFSSSGESVSGYQVIQLSQNTYSKSTSINKLTFFDNASGVPVAGSIFQLYGII